MTDSTAAPSAEQQLAFLGRLQRLFAEGDFTATYKFALLCALADLAVELAPADAAGLRIAIRQIAERFIAMYWRQATPYGAGGGAGSGILVQNEGAQAAVVSALCEFRQRTGASTLLAARQHAHYPDLVRRVSATVSAQPINYLQNFGSARQAFLFERDGSGFIRLQPGAAYCLRRFHPLVQGLARTRWVEHIKSNKRNNALLGEGQDLEAFLFGTSRQSLALIASGLRKLDGHRCFYCRERVASEVDVDHFIPFSLYGRDLVHNFVLAHPKCNRSKSDTLAARPHLERWLERVADRRGDLEQIAAAAGVGVDPGASLRVSHWAYGNALAGGAQAWLRPSVYETVDGSYVEVFAKEPAMR